MCRLCFASCLCLVFVFTSFHIHKITIYPYNTGIKWKLYDCVSNMYMDRVNILSRSQVSYQYSRLGPGLSFMGCWGLYTIMSSIKTRSKTHMKCLSLCDKTGHAKHVGLPCPCITLTPTWFFAKMPFALSPVCLTSKENGPNSNTPNLKKTWTPN